MCFGYDGEAALQRSLEEKGASRRNLFRGAALGAAGLAAVGSGLAVPAAGRERDDGGHGQGGGRTVPHNDISIQLYTLRDAMEDRAGFDLVLNRLAQYGYEKVELAGNYGERTPRQLRTFLDDLGIRASSSHDGLSNGDEAAMHAKFGRAVTLGQRYVVVPFLDSEDPRQWKRWARQMNKEAALAKKYGLRYGYHNHAHEFTIKFDDPRTPFETPWELLTETLDPQLVHLEVDLYWVYTGGVNSGSTNPLKFATDVIRDAPQEVLQYHVKDRDAATGDMCDLGTGVIDFETIFRSHSVKEYIVENDTPDITPLTTAAVGHVYLDHLRY